MSDLRDDFLRPNPEFSPVPIWWWSGDTVRLDRLRTQLDQLLEQGVANVVVLNLAPVGPLYGSLADAPPFLSEQWWDLWEGLCEHAAEVGARLWFYDQIGFSGANLQGELVHRHPEYAGVELRRLPDGTIDTVRQGFDYLSPEPCAALLDVVHGEFERRLGRYLGDVIVGSFQDELPSLPAWSIRFEEEFEIRAGYAIRPDHPGLWGGDDPDGRRLRRDYQRVRAELAEEAFFRPLFAWHERHGMLAGFDQQGPSRAGRPAATVRQYADYLRTHRWFSAPGSDHHGEARIHSSLAHHYGRPRTWIESFHSSGWGGTLEETFDWLVPWLLAGATLYNPHAVYYSTRGGDYEWAPPSTCWRQPYWRHYREFADTVSRLCWLLTRGSHVCDVGVLFPTTTVQAGTLADGTRTEQAGRAHHRYLELVGRMVWYDARPGVLDRCHRDFDVLDDDTVAGATVCAAAERASAGGRDGEGKAGLRTRDEVYRAVVLPACPLLEEPTVRRLREFADAGGLLIVVGEESDVHPELSGSVIRVASSEDVAGVLERLERVVDADGPALHRVVDDHHVLVIPAAREGSATAQPMLAPGESWAGGLRRDGYDFDPRRYRERCLVRVARAITDVRQADPQTGQSRALPVHRIDTEDGVRSELEVEFDAPLAVITWREQEGPGDQGDETPVLVADHAPRIRGVDGAWECELLPHRPEHAIEQWRMEHRLEGSSRWSEVLVGYGTFGWIRGPLDAETATEPEAGWRPLRYSLSRGIEKDPIWVSTLGPKGMVAEEFWHVDAVRAGQYVEVTTGVPSRQAVRVWLAVGTAGPLEVWWNGEPVIGPEGPVNPTDHQGDDAGGYLRMASVAVRAGRNRLWIRAYAETDGTSRGSWALTTDPDRYRRPEWLVPADGGVSGSTVTATTTVRLDGPASAGTLQLGTSGPSTLDVNGKQIGVQGAFDPYGRKSRVLPADVTEALRVGENEIVVRQRDLGADEPPAVLLDGRIELADGGVREVITDSSWSLRRDESPVGLRQRPMQEGDPRWALLHARPHPLPEVEHESDDGVLPVVPDARPSSEGQHAPVPPTEHFRIALPPGAHQAHLPLRSGPPRVWVDEVPADPEPGDAGDWTVRVTGGRTLRLAVRPLDGRTEGALWGGPIRFDCGAGIIEPGPWHEAGLGSFSGAVRYRRTVRIERTRRVRLDLGTVRGTAEVRVNGELAAVRIWSPYLVDITPWVQQGENQLEVLVCNTLAPWLDDASPTPFVFPGQRTSGMVGPIRIEER